MDQQVHALAQLVHGIGHGPAVERCLVVGQVGDRPSLGLHPETEGDAAVRDGTGHHLGRADGEVLRADVHGDDLAVELIHVDREDRRLDGRPQGVAQRPLHLGRPVQREARSGVVQRAEEWDAEDVVEVQMGEQCRGLQGRAHGAGLLVQDVTQGAQAGAQIEDERVVSVDIDDETRGVPAEAPVAVPRARTRSPHAVERDVHWRDVTSAPPAPPPGPPRTARPQPNRRPQHNRRTGADRRTIGRSPRPPVPPPPARSARRRQGQPQAPASVGPAHVTAAERVEQPAPSPAGPIRRRCPAVGPWGRFARGRGSTGPSGTAPGAEPTERDSGHSRGRGACTPWRRGRTSPG